MEFKAQLLLALFLNLILKVVTFALSTYLTRLLLPQHSGLSFAYAVYVDAVLFIAREAVRNCASRISLQSAATDQNNNAEATEKKKKNGSLTAFSPSAMRQMVCIAAWSLPLAVAAMCILEVSQALLRVHLLPALWPLAQSSIGADMDHLGTIPRYVFPMLPELTVWFSIILMTLVEPCIVLVQSQDLFRVVVLAEFLTLTTRLLVTIGFVRWCGIHDTWDARMIFSLGQLAYAAVHVVYYIAVCSGGRMSRKWLGGSRELAEMHAAAVPHTTSMWTTPFPLSLISLSAVRSAYRQSITVAKPFFLESLLRLTLSEGEGMALTALSSSTTQGYYQLVSNLGSLVARLIFRVWENACFVRWSRAAALGNMSESVDLLVLMLRVAFYFGFAFVLLGPPSSALFLTTLYSTRWSTPGTVAALQQYCYAIPWMAWNGLLEAFVRAVASPARLRRLQRAMLIQSLLYVGTCYVLLLDEGADSGAAVRHLILANTACMMWRCAYAVYLIQQREGEGKEEDSRSASSAAAVVPLRALRGVLPPSKLLVVLTALFSISRAAEPTIATMAAVGAVYAVSVPAADPAIKGLVARLVRSR